MSAALQEALRREFERAALRLRLDEELGTRHGLAWDEFVLLEAVEEAGGALATRSLAGRRIGEPSGTSKAAENSGRFESGPSTRKRPGECGSTFTRRRCSGSRYLFRQIEA